MIVSIERDTPSACQVHVTENESGEGTTFRILLPLSATPETISPVADSDPVRGTSHILIVEDESETREVVSYSLRGLGYTVSVCEDGVQGIDFFREHHSEIDLVILDLIMPKLGGEVVCREMTALAPDVPVLIASGYPADRTAESLRSAGAADFVSKPFRINELTQRIARHLGAG